MCVCVCVFDASKQQTAVATANIKYYRITASIVFKHTKNTCHFMSAYLLINVTNVND